jgi:hypothetical protein
MITTYSSLSHLPDCHNGGRARPSRLHQENHAGQGPWRTRGIRLIIGLVLCLLLAGCGGSDLKFPTEYQAVFLDDGQVFFGRLTDTGSSFLMLRDVYYILTLKERDKKEIKNILVRRGAEWHAPEFMRINTRHVVFIEPVAPDSRVAQLIREAQAHPPGIAPVAAPSGAKAPAAATPGVSHPAAAPQGRKKVPGSR